MDIFRLRYHATLEVSRIPGAGVVHAAFGHYLGPRTAATRRRLDACPETHRVAASRGVVFIASDCLEEGARSRWAQRSWKEARRAVWSWDITKLRTLTKWVYLHLHVILDIFARYVVGWMVAEHENAKLGRRLVEEYDIRTRTDCSTCHR